MKEISDLKQKFNVIFLLLNQFFDKSNFLGGEGE